jgi:hypothetical protein
MACLLRLESRPGARRILSEIEGAILRRWKRSEVGLFERLETVLFEDVVNSLETNTSCVKKLDSDELALLEETQDLSLPTRRKGAGQDKVL